MTSHHPLVSIVVINFNYAKYLTTAIGAALNQTYDRCEVVVVDDGSTDNSRAVIAGFGDRVRPVFQANSGQTSANNTGFAAAAGDIVIFLDSDDALHPRAAEEVVAAWRPGVSKVQFCLALVAADGRPNRFVFPFYGPDLSPARIKEQVLRTGLYVWPPTSGNAYSRWFLERVMPLSTDLFPQATDGALNTVAPLYGDVVSINKVLGYYRVHDSNMQNVPIAERIRVGIRYTRREAEYIRAHAMRLGIELPPDLLHEMIHLEGRIASLKLDPARHPVPGDTLRGLLGPALRKLARQEERTTRRAFRLLWLLAVVVSPRKLCERLIAFRFVPGMRSSAVIRIMEMLSVVRRRRAAECLVQPLGEVPASGSSAALPEVPARR